MEKFLKSKGVGFFVSATAAMLSVITLVLYALYATVGEGLQYFSAAAIILLAASFIAFGVLCIFKQTAAWAPFVQAALLFISFLVFVYACYRYFTEVFYGGLNLVAFEIMNKWFFVSFLFYFVSMVLSQIGVHMSQTVKPSELPARTEEGV